MTTLLKPGDARYEDARRIHNGMIDKHPVSHRSLHVDGGCCRRRPPGP